MTWITALPNEPKTLLQRKELWICAKHFSCEWKKTQGGKRPSEPPSIFEGIPKSCMKQTKNTPRTTSATTSESRRQREEQLNNKLDQIKDFKHFVDNASNYAESFNFVKSERKLSMFLTDTLGKTVVQFFLLREFSSPFGFLQLVEAQKYGMVVPKNI